MFVPGVAYGLWFSDCGLVWGQAFARQIEENLPPSKNHGLHVEVIDGTHNWQKYLAPLEVGLSGLAITANQKNVMHSIRLVRRADVGNYAASAPWLVQVTNPDHEQLQHQDNDVILLCKQWMHSQSLAQMPQLFLPAVLLQRLGQSGPTERQPRNPLGDRALKEFLKTARIVAAPPWELGEAASYLEQLCYQSKKMLWKPPPVLHFVAEPAEHIPPQVEGEEWNNFAPGLPGPLITLPRKARPPQEGKLDEGPARKACKRAKCREAGGGLGEAAAGAAASEAEVPEAGAGAEADAGAASLPEALGPDVAGATLGPEAPDGDDGAGGLPMAPDPEAGGAAVSFGCSKCRWRSSGCGRCRDPPAGRGLGRGRGCGGRARGGRGRRGAKAGST